MTNTYEQRYYPGQIQAFNLKRASTIVALNGLLQLEYHDQSLDWLLNAAPDVSVIVHEGESYVLPYNAFVKIHAESAHAVTGLIISPQRPLLSRFTTFKHLIRWIKNRIGSRK